MTELVSPGDLDRRQEDNRAFLAYQEVLAPTNAISPQDLGLGSEEYFRALADPEVVSTHVGDRFGGVWPIPHLSPVSTYDWLNTDHYDGRFPEAASKGAIKHLLNLGNLQPGPEVREALHDLADAEGVLVFDYPERDEEAVDRVSQILDQEGIEHEGFEEIGTQTYYAGKVTLKRVGYDEDKPIMGLHEAFKAMLADGTISSEQLFDGASYQDRITVPVDVERMRELYERAFVVLNDHPCRQGIDDQEFRRLMAEDDEVAKLVCSVPVEDPNTGESVARPATVCLLGEDLDKYPWLRTEFFEREIPEEYASRQIIYFPAIATDPAHQGESKTADVVNLIAQMVEYGNNEIVVAFDCCDFNKDVFPLAAVLEDLINSTPEANIKFEVIGMQRYMAVKLKPSAKARASASLSSLALLD